MATVHKGNSCDLVIAGAGIAGASLAVSMARAGYGVLLVEATTEFRDRVRGEFIFPWGVVEAKAMGVYGDIVGAGGIGCSGWTCTEAQSGCSTATW